MSVTKLVLVTGGGVVALVLVVAIGFIVAGQLAQQKLKEKYPPPGTLVSSGDHKLHVRCEGSGPVTVLMESGLNDFSVYWSGVLSRLSKQTRACAYDRAGLGWSEISKHPATLENMVTDLRNVVQSIAPGQPIILVANSYGAIVVRAYAVQYPDNIKAMVLLDPASEFMPERINGYREVLAEGSKQLKTLSRLAATGLLALAPEKIPANELSDVALEHYRATLAFGHFFEGGAKETEQMVNNLKAMQIIGQNESVKWPVIIVSRGQPEHIPGLPEAVSKSLEKTWADLQADLVKRLHAKQLIAEKSGHRIEVQDPELVYQTILPLIGK
jgi:pimeloyl-ACP methyl ester carboxylesterase